MQEINQCISDSGYDKKTLKIDNFHYYIQFKHAVGDVLLSLSHVTMKTLFVVPGLYTPNSDFESHLQVLIHVRHCPEYYTK